MSEDQFQYRNKKYSSAADLIDDYLNDNAILLELIKFKLKIVKIIIFIVHFYTFFSSSIICILSLAVGDDKIVFSILSILTIFFHSCKIYFQIDKKNILLNEDHKKITRKIHETNLIKYNDIPELEKVENILTLSKKYELYNDY